MKKVHVAILSAFLLSPSTALSDVSIDAFFYEDVREHLPPLAMPSLPQKSTHSDSTYDSDPISRDLLIDYITNHRGLSWSSASMGARQHFFYPIGDFRLTESQQAEFDQFLSRIPKDSRVVVSSFTDRTGPEETNHQLAKDRARIVADQLKSRLGSNNVRVLTSTHWTGDPNRSRRTDVMVIQ